MARSTDSIDTAADELRAFGLEYPGAHTKSPWPGHLDLAVNDKTFAYLSVPGDPFSISCKLPHSSEEALSLPFVTPAAYGLGKSGWVNAQLPSGPVPIELFQAWIDESYRAQAPKRLLATLPEGFAQRPSPKPAAKTRAPRPPVAKAAGVRKAAAKQAVGKQAAGKQVVGKQALGKPAAAKKAATQTRAAKKRTTKSVAKRRAPAAR